jgi:glycosyltransferase involved in cell wall biosynthesis
MCEDFFTFEYSSAPAASAFANAIPTVPVAGAGARFAELNSAMPFVSVIMPAYNVEPYVAEALHSVLAQTFDDLEVVAVDDGSTDGTAAAIAAIAADEKRIRLVRQANRGLAGARNTALRMARGELFALLDSDDLWEPEFLAEQVAILEARPEVDVVTGNGWVYGGLRHGELARPCPDTRPDPTLAAILGDERAVFIMSVFRRRVYEVVGCFDETMRTNEDYDFWLRAAISGVRFARNDRPLGHYRIRTDSLSASEMRMLRGILRVYAKIRPLLADRPHERAILDAQTERFETEWHAAEARVALESADFPTAREHLGELHARRGGAALALARLLARWAPGMLARVYGFRRGRASAVSAGPMLP